MWTLAGGKAPSKKQRKYFLDEMPLWEVFQMWHCSFSDNPYIWTVTPDGGVDMDKMEESNRMAERIQQEEEEVDDELG